MSAAELEMRDQVDETALDLAAEVLYRFLAAALSQPTSASWNLLFDDAMQRLAQDAAELLRGEFAGREIALGPGEMAPDQLDLRPLLRSLTDERTLRAEYVRVFGLVTCRESPPYETEYQPNEDTFFRTQQMADVAGFYRAFGVEPSRHPRERHDYLPLELEFEALLLLKRRLALSARRHELRFKEADVCLEARRTFFREHLGWWVPSFSLALRRQARDGFYTAVGAALGAFLPAERTRLDLPAPATPFPAKPADQADSCEGCLGDCRK